MRRRVLIPGPVLVGFNELFDRSYGDPRTARPLIKVTPSRIGNILLPFACPHCKEVRPQIVDRKTRLGYYDEVRDFSWCPACRCRYKIDPKGTPLTQSLPAGATHAPALVERNGKVSTLGMVEDHDLELLGA